MSKPDAEIEYELPRVIGSVEPVTVEICAPASTVNEYEAGVTTEKLLVEALT